MKQLYKDLWQTEKGSHFGMSMKTYVLKTPEANIVIYYSDNENEVSQIKKLGEMDYQFISHHHEFTPAMFKNLNDFETTLYTHKKAIPYLKYTIQNMVAFKETSELSSSLKIIYTPGHTNNNICLYYKSPFGKNYLFTGDTIYLDNGHWNILVMPHDGGSYIKLKESLLELKKLKVDVVMPSVGVGLFGNKAMEVTQSEWHKIIDNTLGLIP
ncbi:MBL fold metallo-hydrolase [Tenacibaculum aiptasiae]|uniref:MBL fold metallo-hydrolase n=1 Tax=Tenacibaculum aiptasiae TaxID=426481 RepID=A0A7J5A9P8_9FLAO|nr:MBL fold metallo-hydrolase [Tenacibaculum aiptasiae]KAB1154203.1 MBL fold metallo-hydrolase [Tenacibaculum aiptasiae]